MQILYLFCHQLRGVQFIMSHILKGFEMVITNIVLICAEAQFRLQQLRLISQSLFIKVFPM